MECTQVRSVRICENRNHRKENTFKKIEFIDTPQDDKQEVL